MSRILVTGVDGFTGRYLAPVLAAAGHEVHGLVQRAPELGQSLPAGVLALHACDLLDPAGLLRVVDRVRPDKVAHLAGIAFVGHGDVGAIYGTNLVGVRHLLAALAAVAGGDAPPTAVLLASSANIYGNSTAGVIDESVPAAPTNDYAVSKLAMEYMAATWNARLPITVQLHRHRAVRRLSVAKDRGALQASRCGARTWQPRRGTRFLRCAHGGRLLCPAA